MSVVCVTDVVYLKFLFLVCIGIHQCKQWLTKPMVSLPPSLYRCIMWYDVKFEKKVFFITKTIFLYEISKIGNIGSICFP